MEETREEIERVDFLVREERTSKKSQSRWTAEQRAPFITSYTASVTYTCLGEADRKCVRFVDERIAKKMGVSGRQSAASNLSEMRLLPMTTSALAC